MPESQIIVYGATGFTGRLICKELLRRGVSFAIAGRDPGVLASVFRQQPRIDASTWREHEGDRQSLPAQR